MRFCGKCGAKIEDNQKFCGKCGSLVKNNDNVAGESKTFNDDDIKNNNKESYSSNANSSKGLIDLSKTTVLNKAENLRSTEKVNKSTEDNRVKSNGATTKKIIIAVAAVVALGGGFFVGNNLLKEDNKSNEVNVEGVKEKGEEVKDKEDTKVEETKENKKSNLYVEKYKDVDYIIATSDRVELKFKDLNAYDSEQLAIAINELYARYGYVFKNQPNMQTYFESKSWYTPDLSYSGNLFTDAEKHNLDIMKSLEFLKQAREKSDAIATSYVLPSSNVFEVSASDVSVLSDWELVVARNEIFARYGLNFSTQELVEHFNSKSWFAVDPSVGNDMPLTEIETKNVNTILNEEERRIQLRLNKDLEN